MSFFIYALKHGSSQDPDNRDVEQLGLIRLCGQCSAWHIPIIGITPMHVLRGMSKKRHTHAPFKPLRRVFGIERSIFCPTMGIMNKEKELNENIIFE
jgi:hypothetical protein